MDPSEIVFDGVLIVAVVVAFRLAFFGGRK
jgi:hypothetical protein